MIDTIESGTIVEITYPSGMTEYIKIIRIEEVSHRDIETGEDHTGMMWRVYSWNKRMEEWEEESKHWMSESYILDNGRLILPLERLIKFKEIT